MQSKKGALYYSVLSALLLGTEIWIGIFAGGWIRNYFGDVLVIPLMYCLVRICTKKLPAVLPVILFGVGIIAEITQYFHLADRLGFERGSLMSILLGTGASLWDVVSYAAGAALIYAGAAVRLYVTRKEHA